MTFLNQFHKEVTERKMRKIAASQQSPMSSSDFAQYMKRNLEIAKQNELERLCAVHEAQLGDSQADVSRFEKTATEGRYSNNTYEVWDLVPRNVLVDVEGDIFVVDAEIRNI